MTEDLLAPISKTIAEEFMDIWLEYEENQTPEAIFVKDGKLGRRKNSSRKHKHLLFGPPPPFSSSFFLQTKSKKGLVADRLDKCIQWTDTNSSFKRSNMKRSTSRI